MLNSTLIEEVTNYTALFQSFLPKRFSVDSSQIIPVGPEQTPTLRAGLKRLISIRFWSMISSKEQARFPQFLYEWAMTLFAFPLRYLKKTGSAGTRIDHNSPAWVKMRNGQVYRAVWQALYQPVNR